MRSVTTRGSSGHEVHESKGAPKPTFLQEQKSLTGRGACQTFPGRCRSSSLRSIEQVYHPRCNHHTMRLVDEPFFAREHLDQNSPIGNDQTVEANLRRCQFSPRESSVCRNAFELFESVCVPSRSGGQHHHAERSRRRGSHSVNVWNEFRNCRPAAWL